MKIDFIQVTVAPNQTKIIARSSIALIEPNLMGNKVGAKITLNIMNDNNIPIVIYSFDEYDYILSLLSKV